MAQPTLKTAYALQPINKRATKVTKEKPLSGLLPCMSVILRKPEAARKRIP